MTHQLSGRGHALFAALSLVGYVLLLSPPAVAAEAKLDVKPVTEKKVNELPAGPLYWHIENFPSLAQAQAAAGPTSLAAEIAGKAWLFTLGGKGGSTPGGTEITEMGQLLRSPLRNTCFASIAPTDRPVPRRRSIRIRVRKRSMCWPDGLAKRHRAERPMPIPARRWRGKDPVHQWRSSAPAYRSRSDRLIRGGRHETVLDRG